MIDEEYLYNTIKSKRVLAIITGVLILLFVLIWLILVVNENAFKKIDINKIEFADESQYQFMVEEKTCFDDGDPLFKDYVTISGWIRKPYEEISKAALNVVLYDDNKDEYYVVPTTITGREDIAQEIDDDGSKIVIGFVSKLPYDYHFKNDRDYDLYLLCNIDGRKELLSLDSSLRAE